MFGHVLPIGWGLWNFSATGTRGRAIGRAAGQGRVGSAPLLFGLIECKLLA